jgi:hemolysin III
MVVGGILYKSLAKRRIPKASLTIYMTMGWVAIFFVPQLIHNANIYFLMWIVIGGVFYSIGAWFYSQKHRPYFHFIWHLFIDFAAISHIIAMLIFIY